LKSCQGSNVGLVPFVLHFNYVIDILNCKTFNFAKVINTYVYYLLLQHNIYLFISWSRNNKLNLNRVYRGVPLEIYDLGAMMNNILTLVPYI
jgi:hypothetical protein